MEVPEKIAAVIPCHNEAAAIFSLVCGVRQFIPFVIVVDDGSTDDTSRLAKEAGAEIVRHEVPGGKGAGLKAGWNRARALGFDYVLTMDGDGQHTPRDISKFLTATPRVPLTIGNRMWNAGSMPRVRRWVNHLMSWRLSKCAGKKWPDTQCGFRLINLEALAKLPLETTHFEIESEMLLAFAAAGNEIQFVPIEVIYKDERSKICPARDTWRWLRWFWSLNRVSSRTANPATSVPTKTTSLAEHV